MKMKLGLRSNVTINNNSYEVIGIDSYKMINIFGIVKRWISYTLKDKHGQKQWLIRGIFKKDLICESSRPFSIKKINTNYIFNSTLSGIAQIGFEGNKGFSTPCAEILWFDKTCITEEYKFFAIERFLDNSNNQLKIETYFYKGKFINN